MSGNGKQAIEKPEAQVLAPVQPTPTSSILELAVKQGAGIDTIERLIALRNQERAYQAEVDFNDALNRVQAKLSRVAPDLDNSQTRSKYASYAALDKAIRPLYVEEGFSLSFDNEDCPTPDHVRVVAYLSHRGGHTRKYRKDIDASGKGAKGGDVMTKTHAECAADSYGMRYLLKKVFNIAVGEEDTDGNMSMNNAADFLSNMETASTIEELEKRAKEALAAAYRAQDPKAASIFIEARKKLGAKLRAA